MPIHYRCPNCQAAGVAEDQYAGQTGPCAQCGQTLTIPVSTSGMGAMPPPSNSSGGGNGALIGILAVVAVVGVCGIALLAAFLLPAVSGAREAAQRVQCLNNLKQITMAMQMYHDTYDSFPPAYTVDEDGERLHSWRTLLLPYMEQDWLYQQIALDEPWDSPANSQFHDHMMRIYNCPSSPDDVSSTQYMVVVGDETMFPPDGKTTGMADIQDGMSNTIMVVEVGDEAVHWMEPYDLEFDDLTFQLKTGPGDPDSYHPGLVNMAYADGSVRAMDEYVDPEILEGLLTTNGNEMVEAPW